MICGGSGGMGGGFSRPHFGYRSSSYLTEFFTNCDLPYVHDGSTRRQWVQGKLEELNAEPAQSPLLPPNGIIRVIQELMDASDATTDDPDRVEAMNDLNQCLVRDGVQAYYDVTGRCHLRNAGTRATSAGLVAIQRPWTEEEVKRRKLLVSYLDSASEDDFTEEILMPLFNQLGFLRISLAGHKDKLLEYGKDIWMKFRLPTTHFIFFGVQVKKGKLDAAGKTMNTNIAQILNQVQMMLRHPVWDPETNRKHLLDHVFIVSAGEITKQAKNLLGEHLDQAARSQILFMDRDDILNLCLQTNLRLPERLTAGSPDDNTIPF